MPFFCTFQTVLFCISAIFPEKVLVFRQPWVSVQTGSFLKNYERAKIFLLSKRRQEDLVRKNARTQAKLRLHQLKLRKLSFPVVPICCFSWKLTNANVLLDVSSNEARYSHKSIRIDKSESGQTLCANDFQAHTSYPKTTIYKQTAQQIHQGWACLRITSMFAEPLTFGRILLQCEFRAQINAFDVPNKLVWLTCMGAKTTDSGISATTTRFGVHHPESPSFFEGYSWLAAANWGGSVHLHKFNARMKGTVPSFWSVWNCSSSQKSYWLCLQNHLQGEYSSFLNILRKRSFSQAPDMESQNVRLISFFLVFFACNATEEKKTPVFVTNYKKILDEKKQTFPTLNMKKQRNHSFLQIF